MHEALRYWCMRPYGQRAGVPSLLISPLLLLFRLFCCVYFALMVHYEKGILFVFRVTIVLALAFCFCFVFIFLFFIFYFLAAILS